jgi:hypothetical protein
MSIYKETGLLPRGQESLKSLGQEILVWLLILLVRNLAQYFTVHFLD